MHSLSLRNQTNRKTQGAHKNETQVFVITQLIFIAYFIFYISTTQFRRQIFNLSPCNEMKKEIKLI